MQLQSALLRFPKIYTVHRPSRRSALRLALAALLLLACGALIAFVHTHDRLPKDMLLPSAVYYHRIRKGMNQAEVENACGRPEYVQQMNYFSDEAEEWYYSASDCQIQINFDQGLVKRINRD